MGSTGATISLRYINYLGASGSKPSIFLPPPPPPVHQLSISSKLSVNSNSSQPMESGTTTYDERIQHLRDIENLARGVKWDECPLRGDSDGDTECDDKSSTSNLTLLQRFLKLLKILLPHVGLNILLLSYITFGALVFMWLEGEHELTSRKTKLHDILTLYQKIINETISVCQSPNSTYVDYKYVDSRLRPLLSQLSRTHEFDDRFTDDGQLWSDSEEDMTTRWSFAAATLYALTVITSTGYDHITPATDPGRIFTVFFGLVGIPLMFITAADIGKFLSEIVIRSYGKFLDFCTWMASVMDAIKDYIFEVDDDDSLRSQKMHKKSSARKGMSLDGDEDDEDDRPQLPIASYFALIIGYCAIGSLTFNTFEKGSVWSFIHGLFFSFNTITTIGLGNIYVKSNLYLALCVTYVIIGLAVITASLDLCSSTLKRTFTRLHYFGRKIRGARRGIANMSDDIREAMRIIAALKKTRPSKDRITLEDLKRFLEVQEQLLRQPYVPYNVHIFKWIEDTYFQYLDDNGSLSEKSLPLQKSVLNNEQVLLI
uniref:Potassium channel subfamily K member 18 (inferred by orthology to a human protein) n=1 Tax=Strongyloides venezuelensis TaxID=75913 RepID=A0A0K0EV09_STRVS